MVNHRITVFKRAFYPAGDAADVKIVAQLIHVAAIHHA
jgi:hypothetical protein